MKFRKSPALPVRLEKAMPFQRHLLLRKAPKGMQQEEMPCESGKVYPMFKWECKYHVVIVPTPRKKLLYGRLHLVLSVPSKYSIAMVLGSLKGKSAIHIHRTIHGIKQGLPEDTFGPAGIASAR